VQKRMISWIRSTIARWRREWRVNAEAAARAVEYFESQKSKQAWRNLCRVIHRDAYHRVVRVCYGKTKPPQRAFFSVPDRGEIVELEFEDVRQYGERPWR